MMMPLPHNFIIIHQLTWYFAMTFELQQLTYSYVRRRDHFTSQIQIYSSSQGFSGAFLVEMMAHNSFLKSGINLTWSGDEGRTGVHLSCIKTHIGITNISITNTEKPGVFLLTVVDKKLL
jgi:hypothetical protein